MKLNRYIMDKRKGKKCTEYKSRISIDFDKEDLEKLEMFREKWSIPCTEVVKKIVHIYFAERGYFR